VVIIKTKDSPNTIIDPMGFNRKVIFIECEESKSFKPRKQLNPRDWIFVLTLLRKKCTLLSYLPTYVPTYLFKWGQNRLITQPPVHCWKLVMTQVWTNLMSGFTLVMYPLKYG
jgi:hypothetical protein